MEYPRATRKVSQIPIIKPPITAPGMEPMPPSTAATKHFSPGRDPEKGYTVIRSVKYRIAPTPARKLPITKVMEIMWSTLIPISLAASVSLDTARMAIPILVWLISCISRITRITVRTGVTSVTRDVERGPELENLLEHRNLRIRLGNGGEQIGSQILQQIADADGRYHNGHAGGGPQGLVSRFFNQYADHHRPHQHHRHRQVPGEGRHGKYHQIAGHHKKVSMGEIDQPEDTVYHGIADSDQRVGASQRDAGE